MGGFGQELADNLLAAPARREMDIDRQIGKPACFGNSEPHDSDDIAGQNPMHEGGAQLGEALIERRSGGHVAFEPRCGGGNVAHHDGREQRLLAGKARVDGRFSGAGDVGNLVDAGAGKAALQKHAAGGVEDARIDFAGALTRRPADAPRLLRLFAPGPVAMAHLHILAITSPAIAAGTRKKPQRF